MLDNKYYSQLKEVYENVSKALTKTEEIKDVKTIGAVEVLFKGDKCVTVILIYDYKSLKLIEKKEEFSRESMAYSPRWSAVRDGTPIIELFNSLENKPDVLMIEGAGNIINHRIETSSYIGVLLNRPVIAVARNLLHAKVEADKVMFENEVKGFVLETKELARPVYVTSGFKINVEQSLEIVKHCLKENKMPEPLHNAHKIITKLKKEI